MEKKVIVKFIRGYEAYVKGDVAGFGSVIANKLKEKGFAVICSGYEVREIKQVKEEKKIVEDKPKKLVKTFDKQHSIKGKIADIIIPHHNRHDLLKDTLDKLPLDLFNIFIITGGSFGHNCNLGAKLAQTDNLIFMNDDIEPNVDNLIESCMLKSDIVGFSEILPNQNNVLIYGIGWNMHQDGSISSNLKRDQRDVHIPSGFLFRIKKNAWKKLGGFDEQFKNGSEDVDLGLRAKEMGMTFDYINKDPINHFHMQSEGRMDCVDENRRRLKEKWPDDKIKKAIGLDKPIKRALITNSFLKTLSGTESFTYTLGRELERRGYKVDVFTFEPGQLSEHFFTITPGGIRKVREEYDYIFINHNTCLDYLKNVRGIKVFTSHGIFPELEQPKEGADIYVGISKEVKDHLKDLGFKSEIIHNGIDCDRFKPYKPVRKKLTRVLSLCKQHGNTEANEIIKDACEKLGIEFASARGVWNIEDKMNEADLVVSLGRGAYEAMACGRAVVVFDRRAYKGTDKMGTSKGDGIVTKENADEILKNNFSSRRYNKEFNVNDIVKEFKKYDQSMGEFNRSYALKHFNIKTQTDKYIKLSDKARKNRVCFVGSSKTEYGIAKQLERKLGEESDFIIGSGGINICYANDLGTKDPVDGSMIILENRFSFKRALSSNADHYFCKEKSCLKFFPENTTYLPCAVDSKIFNKKDVKKDIDIGFVGKEAFSSRAKFVKFLVINYGGKFVKKENVFFKEMAELYNRCKIVPNQCPADDTNMRLFEATACGALLITPYVTYLEELFDLEKEIVIYKDMYDLKSKIDYYLEHDKEREKIARAGQRRTLKDHTYKQRVLKITEVLNENRNNKD